MPAASYTSPLFPDALIAVSSVEAGRVIVSIQQPGDLGAGYGGAGPARGVEPVVRSRVRERRSR